MADNHEHDTDYFDTPTEWPAVRASVEQFEQEAQAPRGHPFGSDDEYRAWLERNTFSDAGDRLRRALRDCADALGLARLETWVWAHPWVGVVSALLLVLLAGTMSVLTIVLR